MQEHLRGWNQIVECCPTSPQITNDVQGVWHVQLTSLTDVFLHLLEISLLFGIDEVRELLLVYLHVGVFHEVRDERIGWAAFIQLDRGTVVGLMIFVWLLEEVEVRQDFSHKKWSNKYQTEAHKDHSDHSFQAYNLSKYISNAENVSLELNR